MKKEAKTFYPLGGEPEPLGVTPIGDGVNVAVFSAHATAIEFCVFEGDREIHRVILGGRTGDVHHGHIQGVHEGIRYGLRAHGPFLPAEGHRFNPAKLLVDPYATVLDRPFTLHPTMLPDDHDTDSAPYVPKAIVHAPHTLTASTQITPWSETTLYELHVRGFTARHPAIPEPLRGTFAGLAHPAAIAHLTRLGITAVELMPAAAWVDERHLPPLGLRNYWGYNPITSMAPDPRLAPGGWDEIRTTVAALTEAGIETILDVVLNHTGEGDELGPTLSLRGLDNATYYRLAQDAPARYNNDTGCGNTLALDRPAPLRLAMDSLRTWATQAGLHGFRFDLATTMGRRADGFDPAAPLLCAIAQDPLLRNLKLIAEPWDIGPGGYQTGAFPAPWAEWNDRFRDTARRFWRGDAYQIGDLATRLAGSSDLFARHGKPSRSINFITAHDGFTLADVTAYTRKRNEANGEANRDGTDANYSWNHGAEGPTDNAEINTARSRDQRALLATLLLARGTPMLSMGAEFGQTQHGNNNAYAQDNETSWLDWLAADTNLLAWTTRLLDLRRENELLRNDRFLTGAPADISLLPDSDWRTEAGTPMTEADWQSPDATTLVMILAGPAEAPDTTDRIAIVLHRGASAMSIALPPPRAAHRWRLLADSATETIPAQDLTTLTASPRSVLLLVEHPAQQTTRAPADPTLLDRLARAAGIAPDWWDVAGRQTRITDDTRRALLAAMRLPTATDAEARDSLRRLGNELHRRPVPLTHLAPPGETSTLPLAIAPGTTPAPFWLIIEHENGETTRLRATGDIVHFTAADGLPAQALRVSLPALPTGRHRLRREDAPDTVCHLTIAPRACYLPETIAHEGRRFGITAQLYALRRDGDQGIGDFTTLARLVEAAANAGAATVGLNPLHMLFPHQRERASPYHPSDRRFLDPIYLDLGQTQPPAPSETVAYTEIWQAKAKLLAQRYAAFDQASPTFQKFIETGGPALHRFATFQAIAETRPTESWPSWPEGLRSPGSPEVAAFARANAQDIRFHQYLQFLAESQLAAASTGLELGLFRDLAVGAAPDGAEAWAAGATLAHGAWIGAPPDPFSATGQNWHLPPPNPHAMTRSGFTDFATLLAANMRHAGILRIDHVMGLARLFWIPEGGTGADGAYVAYPLQDLLGQLALESHRNKCMVIGEDLGTVPNGFRQSLHDANILSFRVLLFEREGDGFKPPAAYPALAAACVSTHDLPPLAGWLEGTDLAERARLGLPPPDTDRAADRAALQKTLATTATAETIAAAHAFIAATPSALALVQADDLAGARIGVNLPGTDTERPNWRRRLPTPVETLLTTETAPPILNAMRDRTVRH